MIGHHCIKAWSKTQSVIAKSSAESELYSVVKGATEGLGLSTLCKDMGADMGIKLNLDAAAAKGILERQGIAKVRHIDVNVLWLQQQVARKIVPLVKVDGSENCADLLTKHLTTIVQEKHVKMMRLEFRDGRAQSAAKLHTFTHVRPQDEFREGGSGDRWIERGEQGRWTRVHRAPRAALFHPHRVPHGPGRKSRLATIRETVGIDEAGKKFAISDDWMSVKGPLVMNRRWTGMTTFRTVAFDDQHFGGDQRRQRERLEHEQMSRKVLGAFGAGSFLWNLHAWRQNC